MRAVSCAVLALTIPTAAVATDKQGKSVPNDVARTVASRFADCAVQTHRAAVIAYVEVPFGGATQAMMVAAMPPECLSVASARAEQGPGEMSLSPLLVRGMLYEALLRRGLARVKPAAEVSSAAPITYVSEAGDRLAVDKRNYRAFMRIGDCTARAAPDATFALLRSRPGTNGEDRAFAAIRSGWQGCLPKGYLGSFTPDAMRAALAEPMYRLSHQAGAASRGA